MTQLRDVPTMVVVDITNLYFTAAKKWKRKIDYGLLLARIKQENTILTCLNAYASFRRHYAPFISVLHNLGFNVQHKMIDAYLPHVSWTAQVVIDVLEQGDVQKFVFISNDYGLIDLYQYLTKHNRFVEVWSPDIPLAIRQSVDDIFELGDTFCGDTIPTSKEVAVTKGAE